jgi:hypothetical protein
MLKAVGGGDDNALLVAGIAATLDHEATAVSDAQHSLSDVHSRRPPSG